MRRTVAAIAGIVLAVDWPGAAQAAWNQAKTRHFTVYSAGKPQQLEQFATKLEKFDALLRLMTDTQEDSEPNPVQVFMLSDDAEVKKLAHNPNIAGFYSTSERSGYAILSREPKAWKYGVGPEEVLFHEYAHHFMLRYFPAAYPAWYVEGFAEYYSVVTFEDDGRISYGEIPMSRVPTLVTLSIMPLKELMASTANWRDARQGDRYYGTAWLLTHYLRDTPARIKEFAAYLTALTGGQKDADPDRFFTGGVEALEKELRAYLKKGKVARTILTPNQLPQISIAMSPVDPARAALIDLELKLMVGMPEEDRADFAASVRKAAAKFPQSAHAATLLAEAEQLVEDKAAALAATDRAVAIDPGFGRAQAVRAELLLEQAQDSDKAEDWKAALGAIIKANRADTEDPVPLALFYRYHRMKGGTMPQLGYDGLRKAFSLLPQSASYRINYAQALADKGEFATASLLLDPIAYSPHESGMRAYAIARKAAFDAKAKGEKVEGEPDAE